MNKKKFMLYYELSDYQFDQLKFCIESNQYNVPSLEVLKGIFLKECESVCSGFYHDIHITFFEWFIKKLGIKYE